MCHSYLSLFGCVGYTQVFEPRWHIHYVQKKSKLQHQHYAIANIIGRLSHAVTERAVGKWCQCLPLAFVLQEDILSRCENENDVM